MSDVTEDNGEIYVINYSDGTGLTKLKLTDDPAYDCFHAWRPCAGLFTEDPKCVEVEFSDVRFATALHFFTHL